MKDLKYNIIAKLIIKKNQRDFEITFQSLRKLKKLKRQYFYNKAHCHLLNFSKGK